MSSDKKADSRVGPRKRGLVFSTVLSDMNTILTEIITSENKYKSQDLGFSLYCITKAKVKENLRDFTLFRKRGLLLWLVRAQNDHYESKCESKSWGIYLPCHYESECENNLQIFICNHFCVDGTLVDVSDIFFFLPWGEEGGEGRGARRWGGGFGFLLKIPVGGGVGLPERGKGGRGGRECVCRELWGGGGGLNIFFRGRNARQENDPT